MNKCLFRLLITALVYFGWASLIKETEFILWKVGNIPNFFKIDMVVKPNWVIWELRGVPEKFIGRALGKRSIIHCSQEKLEHHDGCYRVMKPLWWHCLCISSMCNFTPLLIEATICSFSKSEDPGNSFSFAQQHVMSGVLMLDWEGMKGSCNWGMVMDVGSYRYEWMKGGWRDGYKDKARVDRRIW